MQFSTQLKSRRAIQLRFWKLTYALFVFGFPVVAMAQNQSQYRTPMPGGNDTAAIRKAAAESDTGRMSHGYQDLSRYNTAGHCYAAFKRLEDYVWKRAERKTLLPQSAADTVSTEAKRIGSECLKQLDLHALPGYQIDNYLMLATELGDTSRVRAGLEKILQIEKNDERERHSILSDVVQAALKARPVNRKFIEYLWDVAKNRDPVDSGNAVLKLSILGKIKEEAWSRWDTSTVRALAPVAAELMAHERIPIFQHRSYLADSLILEEWVNADESLLQKGAARMENVYKRYPHGYPASGVAMVVGLFEYNTSFLWGRIPELSGKTWYPNSSADKIPALNRVTLVIKDDKFQLSEEAIRGGLETSQTAMLRRFHAKYGHQGLDILVIVSSKGYLWDSGPLAIEKEGNAIAWYYHQYLKLPVNIYMDETKFFTNSAGLRIASGSSTFERGNYPFPVVVGKDLRVRGVGMFGTMTERALEVSIEKALAGK